MPAYFFQRAIKMTSDEAQAKSLLDMAQHDSNDYEAAVNLIMSCTGKLVFTGMGKSGIIARKLAATFSSTGVHFMSFKIIRQ